MKEIRLCKFDPLAEQVAEDTIIHITEKLPNFFSFKGLENIREFYYDQAKLLMDALINSLPQGVIEPLLIMFLESRISLYRGKMTILKDELSETR